MRRSFTRLPAATAALLLTLLGSQPLPAQDDDLRRELQLLKDQVARLEARLAAQEAKQPSPPGPSSKNPVEPLDALDAAFMDTAGESRGAGWSEDTSLGGYGEMHLNFNDDDDDQIDFHRWVLFLNHQFTDNVSFFSELELEHSIAGEGQNGEIELEQAYVEFALSDSFSVKGGLFLVPIGILNEIHEPTTFFGTERNLIEREIIPTTWWEGGVAASQRFEEVGLQWDLALHSGLSVPFEGGNAFRIRSGRQKVSEANANEWATTGRLRYSGIPGVELATSLQYQNDITPSGFGEKNDAWLGEAHIDFRRGGFGLKALGAYWKIDGDTPDALGLDEQWGYYIEPSYTFMWGDQKRLGFFTRFGQIETAGGDSSLWDLGVNYWPIENVVIKVDYSHLDEDHGPDADSLNFGLGYQF